jgi:hypothetical protein
LPREVLERAALDLSLMERAMRSAPTFDRLFQIVDETLSPIRGVGELMIYDTALRLGANRGLQPRRVYLHAGTRIGARALGFPRGRKSLEPTELPRALQALRPDQIEDVLCIYKDELRHLTSLHA